MGRGHPARPPAGLTTTEKRVLEAIIRAEAFGRFAKATELAEETGVELDEIERTCDALLAKGYIGPWPKRP